MKYRTTALLLTVAAWPAILLHGQDQHVNAQLIWYAPVVDAQSKLLAWHEPGKNLGWDKVLRLGWDFLEHKVPRDTRYGTGLPVYLINSVFDGETLQGEYWQHNPAMVYAAMVDSLAGWYPYSGDAEAIALVRVMLDHQLAHGTTPPDWTWAGVPFATSCGKTADYGRCIQDMPRSFYGGTESDKVGELGTGYVLFYEMTGERKYLDAGLQCAVALAHHVQAGDAGHTPWPYRLDARAGATIAGEDYGGNIVGPLRLFDELIRLKEGDSAAFAKARETAVEWLLKYPLNRESPAYNKWTGYFEDVARDQANLNQVLPTLLARYILLSPDPAALTPKWTRWPMMTGRLLDWVRTNFGRGPYLGAVAIDEQGNPGSRAYGHSCCSRAGLSSHTSRWAAVNALYFEKTGDAQAREDAFRSLNYATYFTLPDGRVSCCGDGFGGQFWFSDGYADYLRSFSWAMGSLPEYAPAREDHILRSSSVIQKVRYARKMVAYTTFDDDSSEVLRLSFMPTRIDAGGRAIRRAGSLTEDSYTLKAVGQGDYVLRLHHSSGRDVTIQGEARSK
ncbi:MAG: hypothetical protein P4K98_00280 [Bryobacteraceae bacterium]|nr:hypothetical protein [Bryobacteraceae bacterium]